MKKGEARGLEIESGSWHLEYGRGPNITGDALWVDGYIGQLSGFEAARADHQRVHELSAARSAQPSPFEAPSDRLVTTLIRKMAMTAFPPRPGIIGLGYIGGGVAVSLVRSGQIPAVFDVRHDASSALNGVPAQLNSPVEVARISDVVLIAVVTAEQVESVLIGADGLLTEAKPGLVVVLLSTVSLGAVRHLGAICADRGAVLLDAGVSGGATAYENGLTVMIGGSDDDVQQAMPVLNGFAKAVVHCGPLGAGMVAKLAKNVVTYSSWAVVREAAYARERRRGLARTIPRSARSRRRLRHRSACVAAHQTGRCTSTRRCLGAVRAYC